MEILQLPNVTVIKEVPDREGPLYTLTVRYASVEVAGPVSFRLSRSSTAECRRALVRVGMGPKPGPCPVRNCGPRGERWQRSRRADHAAVGTGRRARGRRHHRRPRQCHRPRDPHRGWSSHADGRRAGAARSDGQLERAGLLHGQLQCDAPRRYSRPRPGKSERHCAGVPPQREPRRASVFVHDRRHRHQPPTLQMSGPQSPPGRATTASPPR